jgi:hypothetical protein
MGMILTARIGQVLRLGARKWMGTFARVRRRIARIFPLSGNMFRIIAAATIVVGELRNYSYARGQFLLARVAGFADYGGDARLK